MGIIPQTAKNNQTFGRWGSSKLSYERLTLLLFFCYTMCCEWIEEAESEMENQYRVSCPNIDAIVQQAMMSAQEVVLPDGETCEDGGPTFYGSQLRSHNLTKSVAFALLPPLGHLLTVVQRWRDVGFVVPDEGLKCDLSQLEQALFEMQEIVSAPFSWLYECEVEVPVFMDMCRATRTYITLVLCYVRLATRTMDVRPAAYIARYLQLATDRSLDLASYLLKVVETAPHLDWIVTPYFIRECVY
jgi:hypothetical protein